MIYLEELEIGNFFLNEKKEIFIKTIDFRNSKPIKYLCISIDKGIGSWMEGSTPVSYLDLYRRDDDGNILPIKSYKDPKKIFNQDKDIS